MSCGDGNPIIRQASIPHRLRPSYFFLLDFFDFFFAAMDSHLQSLLVFIALDFSSRISSCCLDRTNINETASKLSSAKFIKHLCIGLHEADQKLGLEQTERAEIRTGLGEPIQFVGSCEGRH